MKPPRESSPVPTGGDSGAFSIAPTEHKTPTAPATPLAESVPAIEAAPTAQKSPAKKKLTHEEKREVLTRDVTVAKSRWLWLQRLHPWRAFSHFTNVGGAVLSAGMSYQAVFAVFASLWVGFGTLGVWLTARPEVLQTLVSQINLLVPGLLGDSGVVTVSQLLTSRTLDWTSLAAGFALVWVTLKWFTGTRRAIRIMFGLEVKQYRNAVVLKLRDFSLAMLFLVALVISALLTVLSTHVTDWLFELFGWDQKNWLLTGFGVLLRYVVLFAFDVLLLVSIVYFLAEVRVSRWQILKGCMIGGAALWGLKVLGAEVLGGSSNNPLLASFAVFVGLLLWFNLVCRTVLLTAAWIATSVDKTLGAPLDTSLPAKP